MTGQATQQEGQLQATHKATIVGFAKLDCKDCFGRGRIGWRERDNGTVMPCRCVEYFDMEAIQKSAQQQPQQSLGSDGPQKAPE